MVLCIMELDFITELDGLLSNVGTDINWKRKVGDLELWISPLSVSGQEKVTAAIQKAELGTNIVGESKRVILSNSIVGVNTTDLTPYRNGAPVFDGKGRDGKAVKVTLEKYLYDKMANWSHQYLDDVFSVYADLTETYQKKNLQDIKFENSKDPHTELQELEEKAASLRTQLSMPQMVEKPEEEDIPDIEEIAKVIADEEEHDKKTKDFDPFQPINVATTTKRQQDDEAEDRFVQQRGQAQQAQTSEGVSVVTPRITPPSPPPQPIMSMPAVLPANLRRPMPNGQQAKESSPEKPFGSTPSVQNEVLERPSEKLPFVRPTVDKNQGSVNPRFKQTGR